MALTWFPVLWFCGYVGCRVVSAYFPTGLTGYEVDWSTTATELTLKLRVQTTGWLGFGFSASGTMAGSDIVTVNGAGVVDDAHVLDTNAKPVSDQCQDWTLVSRSVTSGTTSVTLKRMLDTGDPQDYKIENNNLMSRVIMAFSPNSIADSSVTYHNASRGFTQLQFIMNIPYHTIGQSTGQYGYTFQGSGYSFGVRAQGPSGWSSPFPVPQSLDTYADFCRDAHMIGSNDVFVKGFWPQITVGHELIVRRFLVYASTQNCSQMGNAWDKSTLIWVYGGPGTNGMMFPSQAGFRLSSNGFKSFVLNIHYFNVNQQAGLMDQSTVQVYYTHQPRQYDVGVMNVGDVNVGFASIPSKQSIKFGTSPLSQDKFECTIGSLAPTASVTVFAVHQHMRADGFAFRSDVVDNSGNLKFKVDQDFYRGGKFRDLVNLANPSTLTNGDKVTAKCIFNTGAYPSNGLQTYGASFRNEVCMEWIFYYPRNSTLDMECDYSQNPSVYVGKTGLTVAQLSRSFGVNAASCASTAAPVQTSLAFRVEAPMLCMILYVVSTAILQVDLVANRIS